MNSKNIVASISAILLIAAGIPAFAQEATSTSNLSSSTAAFIFYRTLNKGARGDDVIRLQQMLATDPTLFTGSPTGFFGQMTSEAIKKLQDRLGLTQTGGIGPQTKSEINKMLENGIDEKGNIQNGLLKQSFRAIPVRILSVADGEGIGQAIIKPTSSTTITVAASYHKRGQGLSTSTNELISYPAHIHLGSCTSTGAIKYPLSNISQNPTETKLNIGLKELIDIGNLSINLHTSSGAVIACGDINAPKPMFKKFDINGDGKIGMDDTRDIEKMQNKFEDGELKDLRKIQESKNRNENGWNDLLRNRPNILKILPSIQDFMPRVGGTGTPMLEKEREGNRNSMMGTGTRPLPMPERQGSMDNQNGEQRGQNDMGQFNQDRGYLRY